MTQNELFDYIDQLALPGIDMGGGSNTPLTTPSSRVVFSHLDWLSVRYPVPENPENDKWMVLPFEGYFLKSYAVCGGQNGYRRGLTLEPAGTFYYDGWSDELGSLLVLGGSDLAIIRKSKNINDDHILKAVKQRAVRFTRLDFCTNVDAGSALEARNEWKAGRIKTRVRGGLHYEPMGDSHGATCDVGSRGSKKFVRIYDKAILLKLLNVVLTRIELQTSGTPANRLANLMLREGVKPVGKRAIQQHVDFPKLPWYQDAISGSIDMELQLTPREKGDIADWLKNYVGPAIKKAYERGEAQADIRDWLYSMHEYTRGRGN